MGSEKQTVEGGHDTGAGAALDRGLSQISHILTGRHGTMAYVPDIRQYDVQIRILAHTRKAAAGRAMGFRAGLARSVSCVVAPSWPFGRPGLRPDFPRNDFGDGFARPSDDGGFEEFREFEATRAAKSATCN
jgi:hypothetical protein